MINKPTLFLLATMLPTVGCGEPCIDLGEEHQATLKSAVCGINTSFIQRVDNAECLVDPIYSEDRCSASIHFLCIRTSVIYEFDVTNVPLGDEADSDPGYVLAYDRNGELLCSADDAVVVIGGAHD